MIVVSLQNGERHVGVVSAATMERDDLGLVLMMAQSMVITEDGVIPVSYTHLTLPTTPYV